MAAAPVMEKVKFVTCEKHVAAFYDGSNAVCSPALGRRSAASSRPAAAAAPAWNVFGRSVWIGFGYSRVFNVSCSPPRPPP